ncbi:hypothetical protein [Pseudomonas aeruginosa]|uniref:hypothetical protein n=1 Tax=Pseudomonas aeruginosa TaxID=287 RepID=UPI001D0BE384|nr:hypothetical protein [Pseudomonas aeruginosa]MCC0321293.1 hypothetical protein [Pseudomonas aeruginosa]
MPDMREEFEAWVSGRKVCTRYGAKLNTNPDGMYSDYRINDRWLAWKASRAALRVELPDALVPENNVSSKLIIGAYNALLEHVTEALQQAGIEVRNA